MKATSCDPKLKSNHGMLAFMCVMGSALLLIIFGMFYAVPAQKTIENKEISGQYYSELNEFFKYHGNQTLDSAKIKSQLQIALSDNIITATEYHEITGNYISEGIFTNNKPYFNQAKANLIANLNSR